MKDVSLIESIFWSFEFPDPILFPREVIRKTVKLDTRCVMLNVQLLNTN
jgi:hypothetical protein